LETCVKKTIKDYIREILGDGPLLEKALKPRGRRLPLGVLTLCYASLLSESDLRLEIEHEKQLMASAVEGDLDEYKIRITLMEAVLAYRSSTP
jgi:hypothetical protein